MIAGIGTGASARAQGPPGLAIDLPSHADPPGGSTAATPSGPLVRALDILSDGQTRDLLRNGFPARLHFRVELWPASGIFNTLDGTREWDVVARYDPLAKRFRAAR